MVSGYDNRLHPLSPRVLKRFLAIILPVSLLLGSVASIVYYRESAHEMTVHARDSAHIVDLQHGITFREFESIKSDLLYLSQESNLRDYLSGIDETTDQLALTYALYANRKGLYDQIRYLDQHGQEIVRVNLSDGVAIVVPDQQLQSKARRYYFTETTRLNRGQIFVSAFDLNVEHDRIERPLKPVVRFATPVFDSGGRKRGLLVLNYLGAKVISKLKLASANGPGQVTLVDQDGFWIHGPRPEDEWGFVFGNDRSFAKDYPGAWETIRSANQGHFVNAKGMFTFKTVRRPHQPRSTVDGPEASDDLRPGADADEGKLFTVVSHVPTDELHARSGRLWARLMLVGVVAATLMVILGWFLAHTSVVHLISEEKLKASEARLRELSKRLLTAQEDDRRRISRDLHDDLGQLITAIILDLQRSMKDCQNEKQEKMIGRALHASEQLLGKTQEISSRLRPRVLDELGLQDAVESLVADFEAGTGIQVRALLALDRNDIPSAVSENIFRIVQEALTNVCKHAQVQQVSLTLRASNGRILLSVTDEGVGFQLGSRREKALGILGMRERVELLGGVFDVRSEPGVGTEIHVSMPIAEA